MIVSISGPPCAGKSTLAAALAEKLGPTCCVAPDVFAAFVARECRAPTERFEAWGLCQVQFDIDQKLGRTLVDSQHAAFETVLDATGGWALHAFDCARGTDTAGTAAPDANRVGFYNAAILLAPLPWVSVPGRAEEPELDRGKVYRDMLASIMESGIAHQVLGAAYICGSDDAEYRLEMSLDFLASLGVKVPA